MINGLEGGSEVKFGVDSNGRRGVKLGLAGKHQNQVHNEAIEGYDCKTHHQRNETSELERRDSENQRRTDPVEVLPEKYHADPHENC
jgi:hypothetical protein